MRASSCATPCRKRWKTCRCVPRNAALTRDVTAQLRVQRALTAAEAAATAAARVRHELSRMHSASADVLPAHLFARAAGAALHVALEQYVDTVLAAKVRAAARVPVRVFAARLRVPALILGAPQRLTRTQARALRDMASTLRAAASHVQPTLPLSPYAAAALVPQPPSAPSAASAAPAAAEQAGEAVAVAEVVPSWRRFCAVAELLARVAARLRCYTLALTRAVVRPAGLRPARVPAGGGTAHRCTDRG